MPSPITDPGYRFATVRYPGDGTTVDFEFNFAGGYLSKSHVLCFRENILTRVQTQIPAIEYTVVGTNQIHLEGITIPVTERLVIRRDTPKNQPLHDFTDGAILNEYNLNEITEQAIFGVAEMVDLFADMLDVFYGLNQDIIDAIELVSELQIIVNDLITQIADIVADLTALDIRVTSLENQLDDIISRLEVLEAGWFNTDAPSDGETYGRKDGAWAIVTGDVEEAPEDGNKYGRQNGAWAPITEPTYNDAPSDGNKYARRDGAWTVVVEGGGGIPEAPADGNKYARKDNAWEAVAEPTYNDAPSDGETYGRKDGSWATIPVDDITSLLDYTKVRTLEVVASGAFSNGSEEIFRLPMSEPITCEWPSNAAGSNPFRATLHAAPSAQFDVAVYKNDAQIGYLRFAGASLNGSWTNTSGNNVVNFNIGDIFGMQVPSADISAGGLGCSITGISVNV